MDDRVTDTAAVGVVPEDSVRHVRTVIIGSGFAGLGAAIRLSKDGRDDFLVLERDGDVGGTWRDNTYPGAACDVPSHLYSYSFALNPEWSRSFSAQPEIQHYIRRVARQYNVLGKHVFDCDVTEARWNCGVSRWELTTNRGHFSADTVICAFGALAEPSLPSIPGIEVFDGEIFHSAQWNHDADLTGTRVAVIGTGASAIQIVPAIVDQVQHLDVYQRTAPWLLPRFDRAYTRIERWAFHHVPGVQRLLRAAIYGGREVQVVGLAKAPVFMKPLEWLARMKIRTEIKDPALREKVTPNFRIGCKRMLISNDYYAALDRDDVELVTDPIAEIREHAVVTRDGTVRPVDAIVIATGFQVTDSPMFEVIFGRDGRSLAQVFGEAGMQAYKGATVANFPNMFFLVGPNTGLGHTSMVYMIESQINYVADAIAALEQNGLRTVEVRKEVQDDYNRDLQEKLSNSVWMTGGCASWYLDRHGNNTTLWPDFTFKFRRQTQRFDIAAYEVSADAGTPVG
ncbi:MULTISPECIES: NAD(P)/FAD-dependent oxidoreductase [Rhodococcus]|uniref:NAD(P)/FAD-dependent oxidoreductase n=1 Tax=Rhodococcus oxybenzonivorans TaxID=1990687 RepID=A0AAE5A4C8_9NOCA|nr:MULTISPECIES: NAD(P)/FAD-dependent oxidoreductase [Rhodococcus]MDV7244861.1 NAD(P)/FAD-dependent oxidoreductase [Rhodococcus oxybenzonivorans]MDV7263660.1 NAD(P)/FAD-dependent oxidoreductase [Rhodococcus oxybenzonivorans]MDV7275640.1 NAD(P)/FAD-dependent oxidoreductase [Rhodococcus oxybenzonivorans]MDV7332417.1 NAD(P)/FAD-dependent oxidoreductase [Rhodococcus oxybenzonivorans]MDV7346213.1 NAD(P)/FAD-dependent oxidoreductase [Rhodococcus oxybenzonivorans]